jgi:hypothetical protein
VFAGAGSDSSTSGLRKPRSGHIEKIAPRVLRGSPKVISPRETSTQSARRNGSTSEWGSARNGEILWCSRIIAEISRVHAALPAAERYALATAMDGSR